MIQTRMRRRQRESRNGLFRQAMTTRFCFLLLFRFGFGDAGDEDGLWGSAVHAAALVGPLGVVAYQIVIEDGLHLADGLEPGAPPFDPEVLVEQCAVEALGDAVRAASDLNESFWIPKSAGK
jgi:hypothetical protein